MILIHPFAKPLIKGGINPKTPGAEYWKELIALIDEPIIQVGIEGEEQLVPEFFKNLPIPRLRELISECRTWIGIDSFFQHLAWDCGKPGIVLWSVSDPLIFGHPENINLLADRKNLASNQFLWWDFTPHNSEAFVKPNKVLEFL